MARLNIRAGLLGLYNLRGGVGDLPAGHLPGPAPRRGDRPGTRYYEIPLIIQDPSFNTNGSQYLPADQPVLARALHPGHRHPADLERAVLRLDHHGQRQHLAEPERRAAAVPVPDPQRQRGPAADPEGGLQPACRRLGLGGGAAVGDRVRWRLPAPPGRAVREDRAAGAAVRALRRHRGLHRAQAGHPPLPGQRGRGRHRGHHRVGAAVHRGAVEGQGHLHPAQAPLPARPGRPSRPRPRPGRCRSARPGQASRST